MSGIIQFKSTAEIDQEAAAWVWRLDDGKASEELRRSFETWLRKDARHRRAFEEMNGVWESLDHLAEAKRDEKVATFVAEQAHLTRPPTGKPLHRRGVMNRFVPLAVAATLVLAVAMVYWFQRDNEALVVATAVGQQRNVKLADGSTVELNTNTIIETNFVHGRRDVTLRKGEALFKVAHDPKRPFYVHAGNTVVRAVGTEFNVRMRDQHDVEVIVAEGRVEVGSTERQPATAARTKPEPMKRMLGVGQKLAATGTTAPVETISSTRLSNTLAWREGAVVFEGETLPIAVAELNRYTDTRLIIADPSLNSLRVGGRFTAGDVEDFLQALTKALPVRTRRASDRVVYIEPRA